MAEGAGGGGGVRAPAIHSVQLHYAGEAMTFGWREGVSAREFVSQLRDAVRHATGVEKTDGIHMELHAPGQAPRRVTPRELLEGKVGEGALLQLLMPGGAPARDPSQRPLLVAPGGMPPAAAAPRPPAPRAFQKQGGSQLVFAGMMRDNVSAASLLPEGLRLTREEVAAHNKPSDCWMVLQGRVYDVTMYLDFHPGGKGELMKGAGRDCTDLYMQAHPWVSAEGLIGKLCLGRLEKAPAGHAPGNRGLLAPPNSRLTSGPDGGAQPGGAPPLDFTLPRRSLLADGPSAAELVAQNAAKEEGDGGAAKAPPRRFPPVPVWGQTVQQ